MCLSTLMCSSNRHFKYNMLETEFLIASIPKLFLPNSFPPQKVRASYSYIQSTSKFCQLYLHIYS